MSEPVVAIHEVSKTYPLYRRPVDRVLETLHPFKTRHKEFKALDRVTMAVHPGESVGLMGMNGSGKSTLLQIVCGVMAPSAGRVDTSGRVTGLLELGAGFNPEFTGRQNVVMALAIQGMGREEIRRCFDRVAEFADIGEFMDQPVKIYSSGMSVRLGFAVAMAGNPDILVVDEALAVGDEAFQNKCLARIREFTESGGTLVFVSHSAQMVLDLCTRAVFLDKGRMLMDDSPGRVVEAYRRLIFAPPDKYWDVRAAIADGTWEEPEKTDAPENTAAPKVPEAEEQEFYDPGLSSASMSVGREQGARISEVRIERATGEPVNHLVRHGSYDLALRVDCAGPVENFQARMLVRTISGVDLAQAFTSPESVAGGLEIRIPFSCPMTGGGFFITVQALDGDTLLHEIADAVMFKVLERPEGLVVGMLDLGSERPVTLELEA